MSFVVSITAAFVSFFLVVVVVFVVMLNSIVIIIIIFFFFYLLLLYFIYRKSRVKTIMQIVLFVVGVHTHRVLCSYNKYRNTKTNNNRTDTTTTTTTHAAKANNKERAMLVVGVVVVVVVITNNHNTINNHMTNNARVTVRPFAWRTVRRLLWLAGWLATPLAKRRKASYVYYCSQEPPPRLA